MLKMIAACSAPSCSPALNPCEWGAVSRLAKPTDRRSSWRSTGDPLPGCLDRSVPDGSGLRSSNGTRTRQLPIARPWAWYAAQPRAGVRRRVGA